MVCFEPEYHSIKNAEDKFNDEPNWPAGGDDKYEIFPLTQN